VRPIRSGAKSNLGQELETLLDTACQQYYVRGIANIHKIPTPLKIIGTTKRGLLTVPKEKSIVDYLGEFRGIPFAMEAKKTNNKTFFRIDPWKRESHQREFFEKWNGMRFYLISFWSIQEHYLVPYQAVKELRDKKISLSWLRESYPQVPSSQGIILNFLVVLDYYIKGGLLDGNYYYPTCNRAVSP
jgi:recombination protein U